MKELYFEKVRVYSEAPLSGFAAELFCNELNSRIKDICEITKFKEADLIFSPDSSLGMDDYRIEHKENCVIICASGTRGFIYATGRILSKISKSGNGFILHDDAFGSYSPYKKIRGHQLGYRTTSNTYEAWSLDDYDRYYKELMFFGVNTAEHIPYQSGESKRNRLMKYDEEEFLTETVRRMDKLDLDVSLWHPNHDGETDETAAESRGKLYSKLSRLDHVFIPGGDPGNLPAKDFVSRCRAVSIELKKSHPGTKMWASAQAPHEIPGWGDEFISSLNENHDGIDGVIFGPNHAMPLDELSERIPEGLPVRFYPDITHNVRCEYPVHFERDDWHYAFATCLGRECTNPRPREYARLFELTEKYTVGSVSYSEGINDDVNKFLWSALEYHKDISPVEAIADYCRLFFFGADTEEICSLIFDLEQNWEGNPAVNECIESTYNRFGIISEKYPFLNQNWRFVQLYFRAECDKLIRDRLLFETDILTESKILFEKGQNEEAIKMLGVDFPGSYKALRNDIEKTAGFLFNEIGLQSDVERYCADNPERGAVLDTIDLPISDRAYILSKLKKHGEKDILRFYSRNEVPEGGYHFSVSLDGIAERQKGEPYMNFQGDRKDKNDGTLPVALFNVFDNYTFSLTVPGLYDNCKYKMRVVYLDKRDENVTGLEIKANGTDIYRGSQFGMPDSDFDSVFGRSGFVSALYYIPEGAVQNGELHLEFYEPLMGVMIAEIFLLPQ